VKDSKLTTLVRSKRPIGTPRIDGRAARNAPTVCPATVGNQYIDHDPKWHNDVPVALEEVPWPNGSHHHNQFLFQHLYFNE